MAEFLEDHAKAFYRLINHGDEWTDCRCIDVNNPGSDPLSRRLVRGEGSFIEWCREWNGRANIYAGRNPRAADGSVSRVTAYSFDIDPDHPPRTSVPMAELEAAIVGGKSVLQRWPGGYLAESGNGVMVLYRLESSLSEGFEAFARWLASRTDEVREFISSINPKVRVDSIHDNPRIVKIPGSLSVKGDQANWRHARFVEIPSMPYRTVAWEKPPVVDVKAGSRVEVQNGAFVEKVRLAAESLGRLGKNRSETYDSWIKVGLALNELGETGLSLWDNWSRKSGKWQEDACKEKWRTFRDEDRQERLTVASLAYWANEDDNAGRGNSQGAGGGGSSDIDGFLKGEEKVEWLCEPLIAKNSIGFVAGLPKTMKTWMLLDLALVCAAGGGKWLSLFPTASARTLIVEQERYVGETRRRIKAMLLGRQLSSESLKDSLFLRCGTATRIDSDSSYTAFRREMAEIRPELVIVDSFRKFHNLNVNSSQDMGLVMERVNELRRDFGCTILFVDHNNKADFNDIRDGEEASYIRLEGAVAKSAAAETVLSVRQFDPKTSAVYHTASTMATASAPFYVKVIDLPDGGIVVRGER